MVLQRVVCLPGINPRVLIACGKQFLVLDTLTQKAIAGPSDLLKTHPESVSNGYIAIADEAYSKGDILDVACNSDGTLIACCADDKSVTIWSSSTWTIVTKRTSLKRPSVAKFSSDSSTLLVGDKFGDIYRLTTRCTSSFNIALSHRVINLRFSLLPSETKPTLLCGHVSMLTDLLVSPDDKYLISADRDEKIRVHHYPNTYNIHGFCLGHKQFVSRLAIPSFAPNILVAGGGDNDLIVWDYISGAAVHRVDLHSLVAKDVPISQDPEATAELSDAVSVAAISVSDVNKEVAVVLEGRPCIIILDAADLTTSVKLKRIISTMDESSRYNTFDAAYDSTGRLWTVGSVAPISDSNARDNACRVYESQGSDTYLSEGNLLTWWKASNSSSFELFGIGQLRKRFEGARMISKRKGADAGNDREDGGNKGSNKKKRENWQNKKQQNKGPRLPSYARNQK
ncbi:hypothetical protein SmJEL517_g00208 [Synchytrium microbalum]|uniref:Uncharacterized protein n=1 Tax=Synchytrium microbalum TaxID=1806994 RepID=A0A507C9F5_9FUNG|nr:uncharacterized protein SmJEL517_g00208 [Synchytrium microbalum]TPX38220.1 hypothetical protein SmJEL517_g00208 [Synchytrium microbalum]